MYLDAIPSVDLKLTFIVLPYDAKLKDAFWNLDYPEGLFIFRILRQEI